MRRFDRLRHKNSSPSCLCFPALLLAISFLFPIQVSYAENRTFSDDQGTTVEVPSQPERIVALAPSITELLFALGLGDKVVGTPEGSDVPPRAGKLPNVGPFREPNIEMIVALNPDLVLADAESNPPWILKKLRDLGIPVYAIWTRDPKTLPSNISKSRGCLRCCRGWPQARRKTKTSVCPGGQTAQRGRPQNHPFCAEHGPRHQCRQRNRHGSADHHGRRYQHRQGCAGELAHPEQGLHCSGRS